MKTKLLTIDIALHNDRDPVSVATLILARLSGPLENGLR